MIKIEVKEKQDKACKNCKYFKDSACRIFVGAYLKDTTGRVSKEDFYCKYFEGVRNERD